MGAGGLGGIEERVGILDEETFQGIGVVACPELGEVGERLVVNTSATSGTKHHGKVGVLGLDALQYVIESAYIIYIQMGLLVLEMVRVDVGDGAVTVPLEIGNAGIVCHEAIHYTEHEVLHLWVAQVKYHLVAEVVFIAVGQVDYPILMLFVQFALGIHHFGLNPDAELDAFFLRFFNKLGHLSGQFVGGFLPVTQTLGVAVAGIFVTKPSVIQQEHVHTELYGIAHQIAELFLIEVEIGGFPVVEQGKAAFLSVLQLVLTCPVMQVAAGAAQTLIAHGEEELRGGEGFLGTQFVGGEIGVDTADET